MSETSPSVLMNASPPRGGFTHVAGGLADGDSRDVSRSRLWLASGSSSSGMNAQPWNSPRTEREAYQARRASATDGERHRRGRRACHLGGDRPAVGGTPVPAAPPPLVDVG